MSDLLRLIADIEEGIKINIPKSFCYLKFLNEIKHNLLVLNVGNFNPFATGVTSGEKDISTSLSDCKMRPWRPYLPFFCLSWT